MQRFGTKNTSFVEAMIYHGAMEKPFIKEIRCRTIRFVDDTEFTADRIIFCIGYQASYPFLSHSQMLSSCIMNSRSMYKRMVHPDVGAELVWIGLVRPGFGSIPPMAEMQARYFALLVSGTHCLPSRLAMLQDIEFRERLDRARYADDTDTARSLTDYLSFMDSMADAISCRPPLYRLFWREAHIWFKTLFGPISGVQYRLKGPGADPVGSRRSLKATPTVPYPIIAYEFGVLAATKLVRFLSQLIQKPWINRRRSFGNARQASFDERAMVIAQPHIRDISA